eukprot:4817504-Pyramimonas_sp.AAC.1
MISYYTNREAAEELEDEDDEDDEDDSEGDGDDDDEEEDDEAEEPPVSLPLEWGTNRSTLSRKRVPKHRKSLTRPNLGGGKDTDYTYYSEGVLFARAIRSKRLGPPNT